MPRFTWSLCPLLIGCTLIGATPAPLATHEFGFSLADVGPQGIGSLFIYKVYEGRVVESRPVREEAFIRQALGIEASAANTEAADLFSRWEITGCEQLTDSASLQDVLLCLPLNELWKLRYGGGSSGTATAGWSQEVNMPGIRQQIILQAYRHPEEEHWLGPYFGARAFQLLHDIQDPAWVETYANGR